MPAKPLMSWDPRQSRWKKMVDGVSLRVTCKQLGLPRSKWTKEGSYLAANEWLRQRLAEIQRVESEPDPEHDVPMDTLNRLIEWAATHAPEEVSGLKKKKAQLIRRTEEPPILDHETISTNLEIAKLFGVHVPDDLDPEILNHFFGKRRIYQDRLKRHAKVEKQQTIGYLLDSFLSDLKLQQAPQTYDEIQRFLKSIPPSVWVHEAPVSSIQPATVRSHSRWLSSRNLSPDTHNKRLGFFRRFVKWLYAEEHLDTLPRNIESKSDRQRREWQAVKKFEGVAEFIGQLSPDERAWALLCLNCGMTAADLGKLFWLDSDIELWQERRIGAHRLRVCGLLDAETWTVTRRRSKTGKKKETPTVTYKLWRETVEALECLPLARSGLVFLHESGSPMYLSDYVSSGGSVPDTTRKDHFGTAWRGKRIPLGKLRSIAVNALSKSTEFLVYRDYFLCHAVGNVGQRHYYGEEDNPFFEALEFIRTDLLGDSISAANGFPTP